MNDKQIQCFIEVAKQLNFTKAAEHLYLPQPAVSRYISALETELGTQLFIRESNRKICLSPDGKTYFNMFQRFVLEFEQTRELLNIPLKPLRFGYNIGWNISSFLPEVIADCQKQYPTFTISIECLGFHELLTNLVDGKLDAALTLENYPEHTSGIEKERITSIKRIIIYSNKLFPGKEISNPADFYACDFFVVDDTRIQQLSQSIESSCKPYHFVPKLKTVSNMETVIARVENCLGVAMLDEWGQNINSPGIQYVDMDSKHPICLAWNPRTATSAVQVLKTGLLHYFHT